MSCVQKEVESSLDGEKEKKRSRAQVVPITTSETTSNSSSPTKYRDQDDTADYEGVMRKHNRDATKSNNLKKRGTGATRLRKPPLT